MRKTFVQEKNNSNYQNVEAESPWEISVPSCPFCYESTIALKNKDYCPAGMAHG